MLARNKNLALSRERLLHNVWGADYVGETRTVDVHVAQLRKKLGLTSLKTVSKLGYRLEDRS
jgi:DNA-binding response OmpR family regulator